MRLLEKINPPQTGRPPHSSSSNLAQWMTINSSTRRNGERAPNKKNKYLSGLFLSTEGHHPSRQDTSDFVHNIRTHEHTHTHTNSSQYIEWEERERERGSQPKHAGNNLLNISQPVRGWRLTKSCHNSRDWKSPDDTKLIQFNVEIPVKTA
jgi:hypothetical protein